MSEKKSEDVLVPATTEDQTPVSKTTKKNADLTESQKKAALKELTKIEERINEGTIKYFETGMLLQRIRKEKLYKLRGYNSFKDYCEKVLNFSRSYGYRLVAYSRVWNLLGDDMKTQIPERLIRGGCFYSLSCREIHFVLVTCFIQQYIICAIACKPCLLEGAITI